MVNLVGLCEAATVGVAGRHSFHFPENGKWAAAAWQRRVGVESVCKMFVTQNTRSLKILAKRLALNLSRT